MTTAEEIRKIYFGNRGNGDYWAFTDGYNEQTMTLGERAPWFKWMGTDHSVARAQLVTIMAFNALARSIDSGVIATHYQSHDEKKVMAATLWTHEQLPAKLQIPGEKKIIQIHSHQSDQSVASYQGDRVLWRADAILGAQLVISHLFINLPDSQHIESLPYSDSEKDALILYAHRLGLNII